MTDKERLKEIKLLVEELTYEYVHDDTFYGLFVDIDRESIDLLIEQAEIGVNADKDKQTLIKSNIELNARVQELEKENKRYREALEFYAEENNYREQELKGIVPPRPITFKPILHDYGSIARQALEGKE